MKTIRFTIIAAILCGCLLGSAGFAIADEPKQNSNERNPPASSQPEQPMAQPQVTDDVRALSPEEVNTYQTESDSLTQTQNVQEMNVGHWNVDSSVVLSVLLALVIFAVLVAIL